ncbi:MAG: glycoside hydrolase, partial [Ferruginibacter sp.]
WPADKKERIAELLFSRKIDKAGNPLGIGLSAWRFNIGGGTAEQGNDGGIKEVNHRVECFLNSDGSYDWNKQSGYQWFLKKAKEYGVENLIAFSNTPPVQFTINGLGYKTDKNGLSNLKPGSYNLYNDFLAEVIRHFDKENLHFNYISPVNEPQWDWSGIVGSAKQEGSPWTNKEIFHVVKALDSSLKLKDLTTKILIPEAAMLTFLYDNNSAASRQIQNFFSDSGALSFRNIYSVPRIAAGHSYFTDSGDSSLISVRKHLADTAKKYGVGYWQSEYCMLGDGYKEGTKGKLSQMDCALFLAKVIHHDLSVANATAWQFWNSFEPGTSDFDTRYFMIALNPNADFKDGGFSATKNLWALGHYSRFIRPGMQRLNIKRSDNLSDLNAAQKSMVSAFTDHKEQLVIVAVNYQNEEQEIKFLLKNPEKIKSIETFTTTSQEDENMKAAVLKNIKNGLILPARSITTVVINQEHIKIEKTLPGK